MGSGIKWCQSVRCQWICLSPSNLQFTGMSSLACRGLGRSWKSNQDLDQDLGSFWGLWPHWQEVLMVLTEKKKKLKQGFWEQRLCTILAEQCRCFTAIPALDYSESCIIVYARWLIQGVWAKWAAAQGSSLTSARKTWHMHTHIMVLVSLWGLP